MANLVRDAYENLILELYPESELPFCWQVIYEEAMRNHHFLFHPEEAKNFAATTAKQAYEVICQSGDELVDAFSKLMGLVVYSDIRGFLDAQNETMRRGIFILYLRVLRRWQLRQKASMH